MKRFISTGLCMMLLISAALPTAAAGVPRRVMEATKSVVRILSEYRRGSSTGSGFVIKNDGEEVLIATNNHVVENDPVKISIWVGEEEMVEAEILFTTSKKDLCVLRVTEPLDMAPLELATEPAQHGEGIYAVGYPGVADVLSDTEAHTSDSVTITDGIISAIRTFTIEKGAEPIRLLQINAAINPGNSGGPLFNARGQVIGVNTYGIDGAPSQGVFGAVDISELWTLLDQHGIVLVEETEPTEVPTEAPAPAPEPEPEFPIGLAIAGGAVLVAVVLLVVLASRKKKKVTLRTYVTAHPGGLGEGAAVALLLEQLIALRNNHNDGKLHLQINPDRILVSPKGVELREPASGETNRHAPGFAAPEVYKGTGIGAVSDVYSFAAVLLYAATGKAPANSLHREELEAAFGALEEKNAGFARVIRKAMAELPQDRTASLQELIYGVSAYKAEKVSITMPGGRKKAKRVKAPQAEVAKAPVRGIPVPAALAVVALSVALLWKPWVQPVLDAGAQARQAAESYAAAETMMEEGRYAEAKEAFTLLGDYEDSPEKIIQCDAALEQLQVEEEARQLEERYAQAEAWLADKEYGKAAIAFAKLDGYKDARDRSFAAWREVPGRRTVSYSGQNRNGNCLVALLEDWSLVCGNGAPEIGNVVSLHDGVYLLYDGTLHTGRTESKAVQGWTDLVAFEQESGVYMGLKSDGTVVMAYAQPDVIREVEQWTDIVAIANGAYDGLYLGLKSDGTVVAASEEERDLSGIDEWSDITQISVWGVCVGLRSDGTLVAAGGDAYSITMAQRRQNVLALRDKYNILEDGTGGFIGGDSVTRVHNRVIVDMLNTEVCLCSDGRMLVTNNVRGYEGNNIYGASAEESKDWTNIQIPKY